MTKEKIKEEIDNILINLKIYNKDLNCNTFEELGMDSLDKIEFVMDIEKKFQIIIPDQEWDYINSISETIKYIYKRLNNVQNNNKAS